MILVTGSSGFVGNKLVKKFDTLGIKYKTLSRVKPANESSIVIDEICRYKFDAVLHLAGKAHDLTSPRLQSYRDYYEANVKYAENVAIAAFDAGVKRFVYLSSAGVYGKSCSSIPLNEDNDAVPTQLYSISKLEGEARVTEIARMYNREYVILRPPLIYGSLAPGNLKRLARVCQSGVWLPFASAIKNRTMLDLDLLCEALLVSASHPVASNKVYNVGDARGISTRDLIRAIRSASGSREKIFSVPIQLFRVVLSLIGMNRVYAQLFEPYHLDSSKIYSELGWRGSNSPGAKISSLTWIYDNEKE